MISVTENSIIITELPDGALLRQRILWIDNDGHDCFLIDIDDKKAFPVYRTFPSINKGLEEREIFVELVDPFMKAIHEGEISDKHKRRRDKNWRYIKEAVSPENEPDIFNEKIRWKMIQEIVEQHDKLHPMTVYKYLRRFWQRGKIQNALLPDYEATGVKERNYVEKKAGRKREHSENQGIPLTKKVKEHFDIVLKKYYYVEGNSTLKYTHDQLIKEYYSNVVFEGGKKVYIPLSQRPSLRQLNHYNAKHYNNTKNRKKRIGSKKYHLTERPVLGTSIVRGPGSVYQIDSTKSNVYLVSRFNQGHIVGRATNYFVIDVDSREVAGVYIGFEEASWVGAMMALANASMDKVEFCKEHDIEITPEMWRAKHMPRMLRTDKGPEYTGGKIERFLNAFSIKEDITPTGRADLKGIVEQFIYRVEEKIKPLVPGYIHKDAGERGTRDYRKEAVLNIEDYTKLIIQEILNHNQNHWIEDYPRTKEMIQDNVKPIPNELWSWGISKNSGILRSFPEEFVKFNLMPFEKAKVTTKGIKFENMYYSCDYVENEDWYYRANNQPWEINVSYDPRLTDYIYIHLNDGKYETCELLPRSEVYRGITFAEAILKQKMEKKEKADHYESIVLKGNINVISYTEEIVKEAAKRKGDNEIKEVSTDSIILHRALEKEMERKDSAFILNTKKHQEELTSPLPREVDIDETYEEDEAGDDDLAYLEKLQEEGLG